MLEKYYLQEDRSGYGSHVQPMLEIFRHITVKNAIELGMGFFSTPLLLDHVKECLISVEMQDERWYDKTVNEFERISPIQWQPVKAIRHDSYLLVDPKDVQFALSDGHGSTRPQAVNHFMLNGIETIVGHDTESTWYHWDKVQAAKYGYFEYQFKEIAPYTTVWTTNKNLIRALQERS